MSTLGNLPQYYRFNPEVSRARQLGLPLVALESTVITHGLPYPENLRLAQSMEKEVREHGSIPATMAVLAGLIQVGLDADQLEQLVHTPEPLKISPRDFALAIVKGESGGTTVAGTLVAAQAAGIKVFATGGIGGVHRRIPGETEAQTDISADLPQLASSPLIVVCAGAKAILDLPATLEYLETYGVPVVGYQTDEFPAFFSSKSGLPVSVQANTPAEAAQLARTHWELGLRSAVLVVVPPPEETALPEEAAGEAIERALQEVKEQHIRGQQVTPFMLRRVNELTGGASLRANLELLLNNARLAAAIAQHLAVDRRSVTI